MAAQQSLACEVQTYEAEERQRRVLGFKTCVVKDPESSMGERLEVLIVDDDKSICQWLNAVLTAEGYRCRVAYSCEEAEPLLRDHAFQLALVDIYLGNKNGLEFLEKQRASTGV